MYTSQLDSQYITFGDFGNNWIKTDFGTKPKVQNDLKGSEAMQLNHFAKVLMEKAEKIHAKDWQQVQNELIQMQFYFEFLSYLYEKMVLIGNPIPKGITNHFNAMNHLQKEMEDYVMGGMMEEESTGEFFSADEALELLKK